MYVASFYRFVSLVDVPRLRASIESLCCDNDVKGTVILAGEGMNASIAHADLAVLYDVIENIRSIPEFSDIRPVVSKSDSQGKVFDRLIVRERNQIVTSQYPYDFEMDVIPHVDSETWARLIHDPNVRIVDIRNDYEVKLGAFKNSEHYEINNFAEIDDDLVHTLISDEEETLALYCTGGIRCEKVAQSLVKHGAKQVVQLDCGILGYFEATENDSSWIGECFVFDKRVSVTPALHQGSATQCFACRRPLTTEDRESPHYEYGISCPYCFEEISEERRQGFSERVKQDALAHLRNQVDVSKN